MMAHQFCNAMYRSVRANCANKGIHIGKLATYRHKCSVNNTQYEIWQDSQSKGWYSTCCAAEAKFKFLCELLTEHSKEAA